MECRTGCGGERWSCGGCDGRGRNWQLERWETGATTDAAPRLLVRFSHNRLSYVGHTAGTVERIIWRCSMPRWAPIRYNWHHAVLDCLRRPIHAHDEEVSLADLISKFMVGIQIDDTRLPIFTPGGSGNRYLCRSSFSGRSI